MRKYALTLPQEAARLKALGRREPCRTLTEMAEEFGVSHGSLKKLMGTSGGPKPAFIANGPSRTRWYSPREMRRWWREINQ